MASQGPFSWGSSANDMSGGGSVTWNTTGTPGSPSLSGTSGTSYYLNLTDFSFSLPAGAAINGVQASVKISGSGSGSDNSVKLYYSGARQGTDQSAGASWNQTNNYGSTSSTWGATLTYSTVNSSGFGFSFQGNVGPGSTFTLTTATMTITYTASGGDNSALDMAAIMGMGVNCLPSRLPGVMLPYRCQTRSLIWMPARKLWLPEKEVYPLAA